MAQTQFKTLPQTMEEAQTSFRQEENKIIDICEYFSQEAFVSLKEASLLANSHKFREIKPAHLLTILLKKSGVVSLLAGQKIILPETDRKRAGKAEAIPRGRVYFSPDLLKILFGAYLIAKQHNDPEVDNLHLFKAISVFPDFLHLFAEVKLESDGKTTTFIMPEFLGKYAEDKSNPGILTETCFIDREQELEQLLRILVRESKHNVILLGDNGVGKSVLSGGLAKLLSQKNITSLAGSRVISLNLGSLFATPTNVSYFAPKITEEVSVLANVIIFLEQIALIQNSQQFAYMISFLQDLEKKAQVRFVLPVAPAFYNQTLQSNPYFSGFFEIVKIEELTIEKTAKVLEGNVQKIEKFHNIKIEDNLFLETATLAKRYLPGSLPQKALALLEETCASASLSENKTITIEEVKKVVSQKTGIPLNSLSTSEREKLNNLEGILKEYVVGQEEAVKKVSEALRRARAGLKDPKKPIGSFLFLGPTGVGKTELAKTLAKIFFDDEKAFIRLDMSEYAESHTSQRLIGSPPGYVGYEEGGQLTNPVLERPYCLILLDEIEKAHPRVFDVFLQVLDEGRLTDSQGKTVNFKNTLLIFTSNIAAEEIFENGENLLNPAFDRKKFFDSTIMPIVRQYFRPEFINRFDDIILFNPLTQEVMLSIARLKVKALMERLKEKKVNLEISDETLLKIVRSSYNPSFGARPMERALQEQIENVIAQKLISGEIKEGQVIKW